jgi:hypothetical protein
MKLIFKSQCYYCQLVSLSAQQFSVWELVQFDARNVGSLLQVIWNLLHLIHELKAKNSNLASEKSSLKEQVYQPVKASQNSSIPPSKESWYPKGEPELDETGEQKKMNAW